MSEPQDYDIFLQNIALLVENEGSIEKLAVRAEVPFFTIYNWTKRKQNPRLDSIRQIADAYDLTIDDLLTRRLKKNEL